MLVGRHHHDHYEHHHEVIIDGDRPSHVDIHERSFLEHTRRPSKLDAKLNKRGQEGAPGIIEIRVRIPVSDMDSPDLATIEERYASSFSVYATGWR